MDTSELKVGDRVGVKIGGYNMRYYVATVARLTKAKIVLDDDREFNRSGRLWGESRSYTPATLCELATAEKWLAERLKKTLEALAHLRCEADRLWQVADTTGALPAYREVQALSKLLNEMPIR